MRRHRKSRMLTVLRWILAGSLLTFTLPLQSMLQPISVEAPSAFRQAA